MNDDKTQQEIICTDNSTPIVINRGKIEIGGKQIWCAVLDNGMRVISRTGLFEAFEKTRRGEKKEELPAIISAKNLSNYIEEELKEKAKPVIYYRNKNGKEESGYNAEIIPLICEAYLNAQDDENLNPAQIPVASRAMIILRSFAKIGIIALIDEATGYQYDRETQELQKLLELYIAKDVMKWQKRFPNQFFKEIFRIYGWEYNPSSNKRPQVIGKFINKYVYDLFPDDVMDEIRRLNPRKGTRLKHKHHQYFTTDIGIPRLDSHVSKMLGVMKLSDNIMDFDNNFNKAFDEEINIKQLHRPNSEAEKIEVFE